MQGGLTPQATARALVVDDEETLRETIGINLRQAGIDVVLAESGIEALEAMQETPPDVVVLDVMLPGLDGFEVCRRIRETSTVPILLLSARGEEIDRVMGLEIGADDYLTKPFAMRELVARVRAMVRRVRMTSGSDAASEDASGGDSSLAVDIRRRTVTLDGTVLKLKPKEFDLLAYLVRHEGVALSRDALLREVWGYDYPVDTRTVDVHVRWLRSKIELDPAVPARIETVRGYGYRFVASERGRG
jgi:DNA-binding response OmpR family regulator